MLNWIRSKSEHSSVKARLTYRRRALAPLLFSQSRSLRRCGSLSEHVGGSRLPLVSDIGEEGIPICKGWFGVRAGSSFLRTWYPFFGGSGTKKENGISGWGSRKIEGINPSPLLGLCPWLWEPVLRGTLPKRDGCISTTTKGHYTISQTYLERTKFTNLGEIGESVADTLCEVTMICPTWMKQRPT